MYYLYWNCWFRSRGAVYHMDKNLFNGKPFTNYLYEAMRLAFADEENRLGIVSTGKLYHIAKNDADTYGYVGFGPTELKKHLESGKFKYLPIKDAFNNLTLTIRGPILKQPIDHTTFAQADFPGRTIYLNFYFLMERIRIFFGENSIGEEALVWATAVTILHEIMHNHGYDHPDKINYSSGATYRQTYPVVAQKALMSLAPISLVNTGLGLTGASDTVFSNYPMLFHSFEFFCV